MKRLVLKFGGTSVGTIEKIKKVANLVKQRLSEGNQIIVVVSAMSGATDELKAKSDLISKNFDDKELDVLLASGEQWIYLILKLISLECNLATSILLFEASIPVIIAPNLASGSHSNPPPQPISKIFISLCGFSLFKLSPKCEINLSLIKLILGGLKRCKGLNFPFGFHQSLANFENFSISILSTVVKIIII